jgi:hypothetical protein
VAPSSAKIGSFSETFSQCFFNEMNRPVIIQQVVFNRFGSFGDVVSNNKSLYATRFCANWAFLIQFTQNLVA